MSDAKNGMNYRLRIVKMQLSINTLEEDNRILRKERDALRSLAGRMAEALNGVMEALEMDSPALCDGTESFKKYVNAAHVLADYEKTTTPGQTHGGENGQ